MTQRSITPRRVVITGMGVISPIGNSVKEFFDSLKNGRGGVERISLIDPTEYTSQIAAEVKNFKAEDYLDRKEIRHMDRFTHFGMAAGIQAIEDSGIDFDRCDRNRIGVITGSGIGGMYAFEDQVRTLDARGPKKMSPFFIVRMISDIVPGHISIRYGLYGPNYSTTSACATSGHAIGNAMKAIKWGDADVMICGGSEAPITETGVGGFCAMKALSTRNDDPHKASRPFDAERDGFIIGEGAGIIVLEELNHALDRGARIYAELAGIGFSGDGFHVTAPCEDGRGAAQAMLVGIRDADLTIDDIDYVNAHGTSTQLNDKSETNALKKAFGERAYKLPISSTKSMHGHLLGAAGAVELIGTVMSFEEDIIPPTINYEVPDPECDLNYIPNTALHKRIDTAVSNTFGFGGHNASLVLKRYA